MISRAVICFIGVSFTLTVIQVSGTKTVYNGLPERIKSDDVNQSRMAPDSRFRPRYRSEEEVEEEDEYGFLSRDDMNENTYKMNENTYKKLRRIRKLENARIIGGGTALKNRYPYMASLTNDRAHTCGGTLIADDIVLSAAHCWENFDGVDIGRHNVKDFDEDFERYNIERFITHPGYVDKNRPGAAFNNDFMLVKLYGWSKKATVELNLKPDIPKVNTELTVMGWGVADNTHKLPSEELKEVSVNAMSNNICRSRSGFIGGKKISLMGRITDNMMCAQDTDEDACQGDSGGPLILKGLLPRLDVQVGVVSWGMGCAHEVFPGVYARLSSQMEWIKKTVCEWAESPPDQFECEKDDRDDEKKDDNVEKRAVTVDIMLDRFPKETGWLIRTKEGKSIAYIPIGGYKNVKESEKHIFATVHLKPLQTYEFVMLDSYGDGLKFDGGKYKLWLGDTPYLGKLLAEGTTFNRSKHHSFYVPPDQGGKETNPVSPPSGSKPTSPNIPSPSNPTLPKPSPLANLPSIANPPPQNTDQTEENTSPPSENNLHITIAIKLDNYPEEVGWAISSAKNEVIASKPIGFYKRKNKLIIEKVGIPEKYLLYSDNIMFALLDNGQDGLCCDKGQGLFQVFIGDIDEDNLVVKGSKFQRLQHFDINLFQQSGLMSTSGKMATSKQHRSALPIPPRSHPKTPKSTRFEESNTSSAAACSTISTMLLYSLLLCSMVMCLLI